MNTLPQTIAFILFLIVFIASGFISIDDRKFWWVIGAAVLAGLGFGLDISATPFKWIPSVGITAAIILPIVCLFFSARMSMQKINADSSQIDIAHLSRKLREQINKDIVGDEDYEKYLANKD